MGRKTKKEKIIADLRRKMARMQSSPEETKETPSPKVIFSKKPENSNLTAPIQSGSFYIYPTQLIKKDLTKTILLSILAISLEVALYFALEGKVRLPINFSLPISLNFG